MASDEDCGASCRDACYLFDANNHREKVTTETTIFLLVGDGRQTNSRDPSQKVSRYLVIPVNLKGYGTNLLFSKIPDGVPETLVIRSQLHFIVSRTRHHSARQIYTNARSSTLINPLNFGVLNWACVGIYSRREICQLCSSVGSYP